MKRCGNKLNIQQGQIETFHYEPEERGSRKANAKRTAAYCRVSTLAEEQELSFETQTDYYRTLIENDPTMELVGIYGDQGFSGLHASKRKEFQRLITDCEADKVDVVLVKSISRFSRNTVGAYYLKHWGTADDLLSLLFYWAAISVILLQYIEHNIKFCPNFLIRLKPMRKRDRIIQQNNYRTDVLYARKRKQIFVCR